MENTGKNNKTNINKINIIYYLNNYMECFYEKVVVKNLKKFSDKINTFILYTISDFVFNMNE